MLERNIFDSTVGSIAWEDRQASVEVEDSGDATETDEVKDVPLTDCKGDLRLLASIVAEDSAALLRGDPPWRNGLQTDPRGSRARGA